MRNDRLKWGILGTGRIAASVLGAIRATSNGTVHAIASRDPERAAAFATQHAVPVTHASYQDLVGAVEATHPGYLALYAPGVGTRHGFSAEGFPTFSPPTISRTRDLIERICQRPMGIALHGSSGLTAEDLTSAVAAGVTKVNWSSESLLARSHLAAAYYASHQADLDAMSKAFKATAMDNGVQAAVSSGYIPTVVERMRILGSAGRAAACLAAAQVRPGSGTARQAQS